jgi:excisionase family DNA binding protein
MMHPLANSDCRMLRLIGLMVMTRLLTADEEAERLGVSKDWVWAQARAGRIPHVRLGRFRRFREEALEAWLRELEAEPTVRQRG